MIFATFFYIFFFFLWMIAKLATTNKNSFEKKTLLIWRNPMAATGLPAIPFSRPLAAPPVPVDSTP